MRTARIRELATAIQDGSARPAEVQELAKLLLDEPEARPLTDAELHALGALAIVEAIDKELHPTRRVPVKRLRAELESRGIL